MIKYKEKLSNGEHKIQQTASWGWEAWCGQAGAAGALQTQAKLCEAGQMCFTLHRLLRLRDSFHNFVIKKSFWDIMVSLKVILKILPFTLFEFSNCVNNKHHILV